MKTKLDKQIKRYIEHEKDGSFGRDAQNELWFHIETLAEITNTSLDEIRKKIRNEFTAHKAL